MINLKEAGIIFGTLMTLLAISCAAFGVTVTVVKILFETFG